ncbi:putative acyl-CoA ligase [Mycolicibacterium anyangense]|uniref:Putative acyl-CoA ligase n=1 Tax=Mycolicibacterium anyangense TaxID=1431246 RepID=A0A6N4WDK3_9MYCO|nr:acyl-CoA synthetase [Mycolicibacterium anyangense]BBZ77261.1 putative acyl-CoA ligase [Mycolicibacterium anyangense]
MFPGSHPRDKVAVIMADSGRTLTYGELDDRSAQLAAALHQLGLRGGDVIAMLVDNIPEAFEIYWAAIRSGLYITAINWHLRAAEVDYILRDSGARALFVSSGVGDLADEIGKQCTGGVSGFAVGGAVAGCAPYEELLAGGHPRLSDQPRGADMLYSSGTTGRPKGIKSRLPGTQVTDGFDPQTTLLTKLLGLSADDVYLSPAPIYHAAPLRYCATIHALGGTVVQMEKFDAAAALEVIELHAVSATQMVPTMFVRMLQLPEVVRDRFDVSSLRVVVHAGAPCPPSVKDAMLTWWGPILTEYYSATEGHGMTLITAQEWLERRGSVGRAVVGEIHICDEQGNELPAGQIGTVYFERDVSAFAYHNDSEKTGSSRHPAHGNWSTVGDLGHIDEDGYLYLAERQSFVIISGGVNIYPQEIENVLTLHPAIFDVAVIGVPDPVMGEQVKALVQLRDGHAASSELAGELIEFVRENVAHYKAPRSVGFVDELPRSAAGKLMKHKLVDTVVQDVSV